MSQDDLSNVGASLSVEELRELIPQLQQITEKYKHAERLQKSLLEISELSSSVTRLADLYPEIHSTIGEFMDAQNFFVAFFNKTQNVVDFPYFVDDYDEQTVKQMSTEDIKDGLAAYIVNSGQNVVFNKQEAPAFIEKTGIKVLGRMPEYFMGVPLKRGQQIIGAMVIQTYNPELEYTKEDLEVFSFVSRHIVTAVDRVKRRELTEKTIRERTRQLRDMNDDLQVEIAERQKVETIQKALFEISELAANLDGDMHTFYAQLHEIISRLISAPNCFIALLDESKQYLEFPYVNDITEASIERRRLGLGLTEFVLRQGKAELIPPSRVLRLAQTGELDVTIAKYMIDNANTWLGSPLIIEGEIEGVIAIQSYGAQASYTDKDLELLKFVSHHIATAMERKKNADAIKQHNAELEAAVEQRTLELDNANKDLKKQIDERKEIELRLIHDAHHDTLTDLPNRALFTSQLEMAIAAKNRHRELMHAVLFIDLDRFKTINDTMGHLVGDELLKEVSERITNSIRGHDLLARLGGDEFVVLLDHFDDSAVIEEIATRIIECVAKPFILNKKEIYSGASIGVAILEDYYQKPEEILRDADAALYQAKETGRGCFVIFDQSMRKRLLEEMELENQLRITLRDELFGLYVQPVVDSNAEQTYLEFYLRWVHPELGRIDRTQFRHIAEQSGLILDLDILVLKSACHYLKQQNNSTSVGVNVSINLLLQSSQVNHCLKIIKEMEVDPSQLLFEFDENELNRRSQFLLPTIKKLKRAGIRLVLDNFGSGLASLSYLYSYPFDFVKIDSRFTHSLHRSQRNQKLIESVMLISEHLHFEVIADGIVKQAQKDSLDSIGCKYFQGKLFARATCIKEANCSDLTNSTS